MATKEFKQKVMRAIGLKPHLVMKLAELVKNNPSKADEFISCIENKTTGFFKKSFDEAVDECAKKYLS